MSRRPPISPPFPPPVLSRSPPGPPAAQPPSARPDDLALRLSHADGAQSDVRQLAGDHGPAPANLRPRDRRRADRHLRADAPPAPRPRTRAGAPGRPLDAWRRPAAPKVSDARPQQARHSGGAAG